jgi:hypothetical protein
MSPWEKFIKKGSVVVGRGKGFFFRKFFFMLAQRELMGEFLACNEGR